VEYFTTVGKTENGGRRPARPAFTWSVFATLQKRASVESVAFAGFRFTNNGKTIRSNIIRFRQVRFDFALAANGVARQVTPDELS